MATIIVVTLVFSLFTYRWIEWPFIQVERRMRHGSKTADVVAESMVQAVPQGS